VALIVPAAREQTFPFSAIVGQETLKLALLLNAVDPRVGGVLVRGEKGTAKSTAVRALRAVLPPISVVAGCRFGCDPTEPSSWCDECRDRAAKGPLEGETVAARLVELPVSATEDRLVGTLDLEHALKRGEKRFEPGLLARANRAILYVDEVNLLEDHLVDTLLDAAAMGVNTVEREGVSFRHPARFMLVGTMNPEEGELRPQLLDRFGLCVDVAGDHDPGARVEIIRRRRDFDTDPVAFADRWLREEAELTAKIERAHVLLPLIVVSDELLFAIANLALSVGVDGHRADQAMARAAAALAALDGRDVATVADVGRIAPLVLAHRVRRTLFDEPRIDSVAMAALIATALGDANDTGDQAETGPSAPAALSEGQTAMWDASESSASGQSDPASRVGAALDASVDRLRRADTGRRQPSASDDSKGRYSGSRAAPADVSAADVAFDATLRASAAHQATRATPGGLAINVDRSELREKTRTRKVGASIVFCLDASSSMGAATRVAAVRSAVLELLHDAYQRRDRVSVVAFRGSEAYVVLAPTASVQLAEMRLRDVATGGATPLAAGLLTSLQVVEQERRRSPEIIPWIVLLSDGRANVGVAGELGSSDALAAARRLAEARVHVLVVDAGASSGDSSAARGIADAAGADYVRTRDGGHALGASVRSRVHST
jgi:magnesium chelatase subunit D